MGMGVGPVTILRAGLALRFGGDGIRYYVQKTGF